MVPVTLHTPSWLQGEQALLPRELKLDFDFGKVVEDKGGATTDTAQSDLTQVSRSLSSDRAQCSLCFLSPLHPRPMVNPFPVCHAIANPWSSANMQKYSIAVCCDVLII